MILRGQERADVALEHEVRLPRALDRLDNVRVGEVDQLADRATDGLLPLGQRVDVGVDPWVRDVGHGI